MVEEQTEEKLSRSDRIRLRISIIQTVLAVSGLFVGAVALYAALTEADAVRKQQEASVWPRVLIGRSYSGVEDHTKISISVVNAGIGPAEIRGMKATLSGRVVHSSREIVTQVTKANRFVGDNAALVGIVLRPGAEVVFLNVDEEVSRKFGEPLLMPLPLREAFDSGALRFELCYCSVFGRCWVQRSTEARPNLVGQCPDYGDDTYTY